MVLQKGARIINKLSVNYPQPNMVPRPIILCDFENAAFKHGNPCHPRYPGSRKVQKDCGNVFQYQKLHNIASTSIP